jgi:hypothetical protein
LLAVSATVEFREDRMAREKSASVSVKLEISEESAAFAEARWAKSNFYSCEAYLDGLLEEAIWTEQRLEEEGKAGFRQNEEMDATEKNRVPQLRPEVKSSEKKTRRNPLPGADEERLALMKKLNPLTGLTQDDKGETVRLVLDMPKEWIMLAAWLEIKDRMRANGNLGSAENIWLEGDAGRMQKYHAKNHLWRMINDDMHANLHLLAAGSHWILYPPEKKEKPEKPLDIDDGIPF